MDSVLIEAGLAIAAAVAVSLSPFGRRTLREVGTHGLTPRHVSHLGHVMLAVSLLVVVAAALGAR